MHEKVPFRNSISLCFQGQWTKFAEKESLTLLRGLTVTVAIFYVHHVYGGRIFSGRKVGGKKELL
jgi:hypothetical protein